MSVLTEGGGASISCIGRFTHRRCPPQRRCLELMAPHSRPVSGLPGGAVAPGQSPSHARGTVAHRIAFHLITVAGAAPGFHRLPVSLVAFAGLSPVRLECSEHLKLPARLSTGVGVVNEIC